MAEVNFTLDDFRGIIREEVRPMIEESELRITTAVAKSFAEYEEKYDARFDKFDKQFDKLEGKVDAIGADLRTTRQVVDQHSKEIMELKARAA